MLSLTPIRQEGSYLSRSPVTKDTLRKDFLMKMKRKGCSLSMSVQEQVRSWSIISFAYVRAFRVE